jgi:hypothetical protein
MISSTTPGSQGYLALESIFHEVSHAGSLSGPLQATLEAAFATRNTDEPERFWHAVIFYSAGTITRELLSTVGVEDYSPYAVRFGLYDRSPDWARYRTVLDETWAPYLKGDEARATAIDRMVASLVP